MKKIFYSSILIMFALFTVNTQAQTQPSENTNYVVLTRKVPQLKPILLAAQELAKQDGHHFGDFQVVVCGKAVQNLTNEEMMKDFISQAGQANVTINACGFSLKKFGVDREKLHQSLNVVENGILYNFELQKKGYLSIEL
ncbi:sulfur reduction protein DsrE [Salinimicrobium sp. MT39]|uniref:Sulfur reduction protein DsrE n=1 Tax=Salinimicrobium profundisediminis TaxID=2994553 RepID=A0A9X3CYX3_9FLAO|nr:sulfur reduction protein DsrE [Salinimicrobium profundisediminis]MCX2839215.1 sulfur reduction protein DsrE [Salinimicrobium profundisediminis]